MTARTNIVQLHSRFRARMSEESRVTTAYLRFTKYPEAFFRGISTSEMTNLQAAAIEALNSTSPATYNHVTLDWLEDFIVDELKRRGVDTTSMTRPVVYDT